MGIGADVGFASVPEAIVTSSASAEEVALRDETWDELLIEDGLLIEYQTKRFTEQPKQSPHKNQRKFAAQATVKTCVASAEDAKYFSGDYTSLRLDNIIANYPDTTDFESVCPCCKHGIPVCAKQKRMGTGAFRTCQERRYSDRENFVGRAQTV